MQVAKATLALDESPPKLTPIGRKIQTLLDELNQTPAWLAETVGVSRSTITRILKAERNPTPETLHEIAPVLGLTVAQLANGTDAAERVKEAKVRIPGIVIKQTASS